MKKNHSKSNKRTTKTLVYNHKLIKMEISYINQPSTQANIVMLKRKGHLPRASTHIKCPLRYYFFVLIVINL